MRYWYQWVRVRIHWYRLATVKVLVNKIHAIQNISHLKTYLHFCDIKIHDIIALFDLILLVTGMQLDIEGHWSMPPLMSFNILSDCFNLTFDQFLCPCGYTIFLWFLFFFSSFFLFFFFTAAMLANPPMTDQPPECFLAVKCPLFSLVLLVTSIRQSVKAANFGRPG